jgi:phage gpG-like protein
VQINIDSLDVLKAIGDLEARGKALTGLTPVIAQMLEAAVADVFDAEGPGCKDLAESTQKGRRGTSYKILQNTGNMAGSVTGAHGSDWAEAFDGSGYGNFHVTGTKFMPVRDPFNLGPFLKDVLDDTADLLLEAVSYTHLRAHETG